MSAPDPGPAPPPELPSGPGAAAILSAGFGCLVFGLLAFAGDASPAIKQAFILWKPSGPLSGVSSLAIVAWLFAWFILALLWARREINLAWVTAVSLAMLAAGLLLTFPPFMDLLQGK